MIPSQRQLAIPTTILQAKSVKKKKSTNGASGGGLKGFGSVTSVKLDGVETDRSKEARLFYDFLERGGAGDNLSRCALGYFSLGDAKGGLKLRGIVALKDMKKGDVMIRIPYDLAINLGPEGVDPTGPGLAFLRDYCETLASEAIRDSSKSAYYRLLPPFRGDDCMGSTDFFSNEALDALQAPLVIRETLQRRERVTARFVSDVDDSFPQMD